ncbi:oligopeptide ABC transporter, ATP-binding protein, partial [gut metagenome]
MKTILEVKDLTKTFMTEGKADFIALDHIHFQLFHGECLGIVGESGSGKSTLAKVITRLTDATEGRVSLCGEDITEVKGKHLREVYKSIQMIFQ